MYRVELVPFPISDFIRQQSGNILSEREASMMDYCHKLGQVYAGFIDDKFVCCWGLIPGSFISNQAYLWMWSQGPIAHQFTFIRRSQIQVQEMLKRYPTIVGHCKRSSRSAQRWLKWLGAEFEPTTGDVLSFTIRRVY